MIPNQSSQRLSGEARTEALRWKYVTDERVLHALLVEHVTVYNIGWVDEFRTRTGAFAVKWWVDGPTMTYSSVSDAQSFLDNKRSTLREMFLHWSGTEYYPDSDARYDKQSDCLVFEDEEENYPLPPSFGAILGRHREAIEEWERTGTKQDLYVWFQKALEVIVLAERRDIEKQEQHERDAAYRAEIERIEEVVHQQRQRITIALSRAATHTLVDADEVAIAVEEINRIVQEELSRATLVEAAILLYGLLLEHCGENQASRLGTLLRERQFLQIEDAQSLTPDDLRFCDRDRSGRIARRLAWVNGEIDQLQLELRVSERSDSHGNLSESATESAGDASTLQRASGEIPRLRLRVALTTVTRLVHAMTAAGWLPETTPVATIVGNIFAEASTARDREGSYNAAAARIKDSAERHGMILRLMVALLDEIPADDLDALAEAIERHRRP